MCFFLIYEIILIIVNMKILISNQSFITLNVIYFYGILSYSKNLKYKILSRLKYKIFFRFSKFSKLLKFFFVNFKYKIKLKLTNLS